MSRRPALEVVHAAHRGQAGMALLAVLVVLLVIVGSSAAFIGFMNLHQTRAGARLRTNAAAALAEAGVHRALGILEGTAPDGRTPGRLWRPSAYAERRTVGAFAGRFTLSLVDEADGAIAISSRGEVAGAVRRVRARAYLASPALLVALHGRSFIRLEEPPAATVVLPYGAGIGDRPWIHMAAGREVWFATTDVSVNDPSARIDAGPGPVDGPSDTFAPRPGPVRILLARGAEVTLGPDHQRVDFQQLRAAGVHIEGVVLETQVLPAPPDVDRVYYQARARAHTENAAVNRAAGEYLGDEELERKTDSFYSRTEWERVQAYLRTRGAEARLAGIVYIAGGLSLGDGERLRIVDGALVTESSVLLSQGAHLEITHAAATRTLPALIVLDNGALVVQQTARLRAHGLVYSSKIFDVGEGARVDIVGAVLGNDRGLAFRNHAGLVVIRYDPAVLGTPGLRVPEGSPVVAWVAKWEDFP